METNQFIKMLGDADFQSELLKQPNEALRNIGVEISDDVQVKVVRSTSDSVNIVFPAHSLEGHELSDDQLAKIAGGEVVFTVAPGTVWAVISIASIAAVAVAAVAGTLTAVDHYVGIPSDF